MIVRLMFYRAGGRAGANILLMWRNFRGRLFRLRRLLLRLTRGMSRNGRGELA